MEQRLSLITLGVADVAAARAFYERLGWRVGMDVEETVFFVDPDGHPWEVAHNPAFELTADGGVHLPPG